jgi:hypothetical protein
MPSAINTFTTEAVSAYAMSEDPSSHPYYGASAADYALKHWKRGSDAPYNPDYYSFKNDCQNFVSQALYEGGDITMFIPKPEEIGNGGSGWYYLGYDIGLDGINGIANTNKASAAWTIVESFFNVSTLQKNGEPGEAWKEYYNQGPEGTLLAQRPGTAPDEVPAGLMPGDVIQVEWPAGPNDTNGSDYDHTAIVVDIQNGIPNIAAHTSDVYGMPYTILKPWEEIRFIHIERSNGYPPIKTEIQAPNDDAGSEPYKCANSSTSLNEVYFWNLP